MKIANLRRAHNFNCLTETMQLLLTEILLKGALTFQNATVSWSDGRPTGFLRWNRNYFRGHGPDSVKYYSQDHGDGSQNADLCKQLLKRAQSVLQPEYTNETLCTALIGSPGPQDMEFVSIPCNMELLVSGIMCIKGGDKFSRNGFLYRLTHVKLEAKDSQLVNNATSNSFIIDTLYEARFKGKSPPHNQGSSRSPIYHDNLNQGSQSKYYHLFSKSMEQAWKEDIQSCNKSRESADLCDLLWPYNETSTNNIQKMTMNIALTKLDRDIRNTPLSISVSGNGMFAFNYCREGAVFDGKQCIRPFQTLPDTTSATLDNLCHRSSKESHLYVYTVDSNLDTLAFLLQRLDIVNGQATCRDELGNTVVLFLDAGKVSARVYSEVDPVTKYVVCSLQPVQPTCPPAYVKCNNGCISDLFLCDGKVDCDNGEDEQNCSHLCNVLNATPHYCLARCHPENCACHELYFQCSSGGCIHSSKVCDGETDCVSGEDEFICLSPTSTRRHINTTNDFIPDEIDSPDEEAYINLLKSVSKQTDHTCGSMQEVTCMKGHPACYPLNKTCLYDHTEDGRLKYCRNGLHLLGCEHFWCSGSFKCQHSYCVPTYKVCNGVQDCPYGDDEATCPVSACTNMLRCGQTCVHPNEICDGTMQCEFGEDELACGAPNCPPTCHCSGYAMKCHTWIQLDTSFKHLIMFTLRYPKLVLAKQIFRAVTSLLILDMSYCNITSISSEGPFLELNLLVKLDVSHNAVSSLTYGSLHGLINLMELDISWNPLSYLEPRTFVHLSRLHVLFIQHCQLGLFPDNLFPSSPTLDIIDMSSCGMVDLGCFSVRVNVLNLTKTIIRFDKDYSKRCWKDVSHVVSDQTGFYCLDFVKERCAGSWAIECKNCQALFPSQVLLIYCCFLIMVIGTCNCCVFIYKLLTQTRDAVFICNLALAEMLIVVPLYLFITWHVSHGAEFAFYEAVLSRSMPCRISGDILVVSTQLIAFFQMLISLHKYYAIVRRYDFLAVNKMFFYLVAIAAWATSVLSVVFLHLQDMHNAQITGLLKGLFFYYLYWYPILPAYSALNILLAVAALSSYGLILKNICETRITRIGRKHGRDHTLSSIIRISFIIILLSTSVLAIMCFTAWLSQAATESSNTVILVVLIFPLQAVFNPFLYTLSTKQFVRDCGVCFPSVTETLRRALSKRE